MAASIQSEDGDAGFQIAPMVDVVFVLLLFFMASAGMKIAERELAVSVPSVGTGETVPVVVSIAADGAVRINEQPYAAAQDRDLSRFRQWFRGTIQEFGDNPVMLQPAPEVKQQRIVEILDALSNAGAKKVSFS